MKVGDVILACECINCVVLDALGNEINVTLEDYQKKVEHLSARNNEVLIWTFDNFDKLEGLKEIEEVFKTD